MQANQKHFHEAFSRPAIRTAPFGYATPEAAEAEGWVFDAAAGRWCLPASQADLVGRLAKLAKTLTDARVDAMGLPELRVTLQVLAAMPVPDVDKQYRERPRADPLPPGSQGEIDALRTEEIELREQVKRNAARVQIVARAVRKTGGEFLAGSGTRCGVASGGSRCRACGKSAAKLLSCSRCRTVYYCDATCQLGDWKRHKVACKEASKLRADAEADGRSDPTKISDVIAWYVPSSTISLLLIFSSTSETLF